MKCNFLASVTSTIVIYVHVIQMKLPYPFYGDIEMEPKKFTINWWNNRNQQMERRKKLLELKLLKLINCAMRKTSIRRFQRPCRTAFCNLYKFAPHSTAFANDDNNAVLYKKKIIHWQNSLRVKNYLITCTMRPNQPAIFMANALKCPTEAVRWVHFTASR